MVPIMSIGIDCAQPCTESDHFVFPAQPVVFLPNDTPKSLITVAQQTDDPTNLDVIGGLQKPRRVDDQFSDREPLTILATLYSLVQQVLVEDLIERPFNELITTLQEACPAAIEESLSSVDSYLEGEQEEEEEEQAEGPEDGREGPDEQNLSDLMSMMGLPSQFGEGNKKKHKKRGTKKSKYKKPKQRFSTTDSKDDDGFQDLKPTGPTSTSSTSSTTSSMFDVYWRTNQQFLFYAHWLRAYHKEMAPDAFKEFCGNLRDYDQSELIPLHRLNLNDFRGQSKTDETSIDSETSDVNVIDWDTRWAELTTTDDLRKKCRKEYLSHTQSLKQQPKCLSAAQKFLANQGFALGRADMEGASPNNQLVSCDVQRFREDNSYDFPFYFETNTLKPPKKLLSEVPDNCCSRCSSSVSGSDDPSSFEFNPATDGHLVAKNVKVTKKLQKYWRQRFRLFTRFNRGVLMDDEGWYSVTPESLAAHIADRCSNASVIVDGFCGVGGNAIQFARRGARVIAIDMDPIKIKCSRRNAEIYGVADRIEFICANYFHVIGGIKADVVFLSPPWGGPNYQQLDTFDMQKDMTPDGFAIFEAARAVTRNIVMFMPKNTNVKQLVSLAGRGGSVDIEQGFVEYSFPRLKAITAYYGDLVNASAEKQ